ncbi:hypothetical protein BD311DRAFT_747387 [Dichomitus squalens]|uniref:Secreted protein n=1 Tax=Dichomitus squalens TaxID=114155 RepID=A0A4Q9N1A5_9APHY|nr:hypothetical protein BD311DRAFT_747387 [Dichomitus squalens]
MLSNIYTWGHFVCLVGLKLALVVLASTLHEGVAVPRSLTAGVPHYTPVSPRGVSSPPCLHAIPIPHQVLDYLIHLSWYIFHTDFIALGAHAIPR